MKTNAKDAKFIFPVIVALVLLILIIGLTVFLSYSGIKISNIIQPKRATPSDSDISPATQPMSPLTKKENALPDINTAASKAEIIGSVGEVAVKDEKSGEEKPLLTPVLPFFISSTVGKIVTIASDSLVVSGDGNNFADNQPRQLKCFFTDQTITFSKTQSRYVGREGVAILKVGQRILIEGDGNIRGKDEFEVKTINILE